MGIVADAVKALLAEAGRTSNSDKELAEFWVKQTIDDINKRIHLGVLRAEDDITVTAGDSSYDLADDFGSMIMIGKYDSTGDRINPEWKYLGDFRFTENYSTVSSASVAAGEPAGYLYLPLTALAKMQIRIVPTPDSAMTARCYYYAKLTDENVDRLKWAQPLIDGAKRHLQSWFPTGFAKAESDYFNDIRILEPPRRDNPMSPLRQHPEVITAGKWMRRVP
jgi:hypothetical protein